MHALPPAPVFTLAEAFATPSAIASADASRPAAINFFDVLPRHDPRTAALLSMGITGLGQFYNGEPAKGWWMLSPWAIYPLAWGADTYLQTGYFRTGALVLALGVKGYSILDAWAVARPKAPK